MEPLATNRQCLIWLRVCPADESQGKLAHTICLGYSNFINMCNGSMFGIRLGIRFDWFGTIHIWICVCHRWNFCNLHNLQAQWVVIWLLSERITIVSSSKQEFLFVLNLDQGSDAFHHLAHANDTSEWMWKIYFPIKWQPHCSWTLLLDR